MVSGAYKLLGGPNGKIGRASFDLSSKREVNGSGYNLQPVPKRRNARKMESRSLGSTELMVSRLGLGLAALGIAGGMSEFTYAGAAVLAIVALVLVVGHHVS